MRYSKNYKYFFFFFSGKIGFNKFCKINIYRFSAPVTRAFKSEHYSNKNKYKSGDKLHDNLAALARVSEQMPSLNGYGALIGLNSHINNV